MMVYIWMYLAVAGISMVVTALMLLGDHPFEFDGFWDWFVYNLLWGKLVLKYVGKHLANW